MPFGNLEIVVWVVIGVGIGMLVRWLVSRNK
jgi:hypothetical protein